MTEWDGNILELIIVLGLFSFFLSSPFLIVLSIVIQNNEAKNPSTEDIEELIETINQPFDTPNKPNNNND